MHRIEATASCASGQATHWPSGRHPVGRDKDHGVRHNLNPSDAGKQSARVPTFDKLCKSFLHRLAADQHVLANLSIVSSAYGEGAWGDTQGMLSLWRIVCERS